MAPGHLFFLVPFSIILAFAPAWGKGSDQPPPAHESPPPQDVFPVDELNEGAPASAGPINLRTPQETLKHFFDASREGDFTKASRTLNLASIPIADRPWYAPYLAERFYYVLNKQPWINRSTIPDREDGQLDADSGAPSPDMGKPRRSIKIATIPLNRWDIEIRLERFKPSDGPAVWLFSPATVEKIIPLYQTYGPGPLVQYFPTAVRRHLYNGDPFWQGLIMLVAVIAAAGIGLFMERLIVFLLQRFGSTFVKVAASRTQGPIVLLMSAFAFYYVTYTLLSLSGPVFGLFEPIVSIVLIISLTWLGIRLIELLAEVYSNIYRDRIALEEESEARKLLTHVSIIRRLVMFCAVCAGVGVGIYQARILDGWSASFLASAGIISVIIGIAAQNVLGNILAGVQIAVTQPARIGDSVSFEGNWGYIEDIGFTYVTIRTWDARRLVVPVAYFISHPFENWSMRESNVLSVIHLFVDYGTNIELVRAKFAELLRSCPLWDGRAEPSLQVIGVREQCIELRAICSAKDGPTAWNLSCLLREQLVAFIQSLENGRFLPKYRLVETQEEAPPNGQPRPDQSTQFSHVSDRAPRQAHAGNPSPPSEGGQS
ncbi:MAG: mechanosensitive ion channel [Nitrospira sp.]